MWNDYEKTVRQKNGRGGGGGGEGVGGGKRGKEIMHSTSQRAFEILAALGKCLPSYGIALKWYIPEGKESHLISFCMYKFEKVRRRADRHERTCEPSGGKEV